MKDNAVGERLRFPAKWHRRRRRRRTEKSSNFVQNYRIDTNRDSIDREIDWTAQKYFLLLRCQMAQFFPMDLGTTGRTKETDEKKKPVKMRDDAIRRKTSDRTINSRTFGN